MARGRLGIWGPIKPTESVERNIQADGVDDRRQREDKDEVEFPIHLHDKDEWDRARPAQPPTSPTSPETSPLTDVEDRWDRARPVQPSTSPLTDVGDRWDRARPVQPATSPRTLYEPPTSPRTPHEPPTSPRTPHEPPTSPRTPHEPPTSPRTPHEPPTSPRTPHEPPTSPRTPHEPPTSPHETPTAPVDPTATPTRHDPLGQEGPNLPGYGVQAQVQPVVTSEPGFWGKTREFFRDSVEEVGQMLVLPHHAAWAAHDKLTGQTSELSPTERSYGAFGNTHLLANLYSTLNFGHTRNDAIANRLREKFPGAEVPTLSLVPVQDFTRAYDDDKRISGWGDWAAFGGALIETIPIAAIPIAAMAGKPLRALGSKGLAQAAKGMQGARGYALDKAPVQKFLTDLARDQRVANLYKSGKLTDTTVDAAKAFDDIDILARWDALQRGQKRAVDLSEPGPLFKPVQGGFSPPTAQRLHPRLAVLQQEPSDNVQKVLENLAREQRDDALQILQKRWERFGEGKTQPEVGKAPDDAFWEATYDRGIKGEELQQAEFYSEYAEKMATKLAKDPPPGSSVSEGAADDVLAQANEILGQPDPTPATTPTASLYDAPAQPGLATTASLYDAPAQPALATLEIPRATGRQQEWLARTLDAITARHELGIAKRAADEAQSRMDALAKAGADLATMAAAQQHLKAAQAAAVAARISASQITRQRDLAVEHGIWTPFTAPPTVRGTWGGDRGSGLAEVVTEPATEVVPRGTWGGDRGSGSAEVVPEVVTETATETATQTATETATADRHAGRH